MTPCNRIEVYLFLEEPTALHLQGGIEYCASTLQLMVSGTVPSRYRAFIGDHDQISQSVGTLIVFAIKRGVQFSERVSPLSEGVVAVHSVLSYFAFSNYALYKEIKSTVLWGAGIARYRCVLDGCGSIPAREIYFSLLHSGHTCSGVHPASRIMATVGFFPQG